MGILETQIENRFVSYAEEEPDVLVCVKMNIKGRKGWPDRMMVMDYGHSFFIEFKVPGAPPGKLQIHIHNELTKRGHRIYVCDGFEEAVSALQRERVYATKLSKAVDRISAEES